MRDAVETMSHRGAVEESRHITAERFGEQPMAQATAALYRSLVG